MHIHVRLLKLTYMRTSMHIHTCVHLSGASRGAAGMYKPLELEPGGCNGLLLPRQVRRMTLYMTPSIEQGPNTSISVSEL